MQVQIQISPLLTPQSLICGAGHRGMVGSVIVGKLQTGSANNRISRSHTELDLTEQQEMRLPSPANLQMQTNIINKAPKAGIDNLLFLGRYPNLAPQTMKEEYLLTGPLEPTKEFYAIAKIAGIKMCESYNHQYVTICRSVMLTNLYGPGETTPIWETTTITRP